MFKQLIMKLRQERMEANNIWIQNMNYLCGVVFFYSTQCIKTESIKRGKMSFELLSLRYLANVSTFL